MPIERELRKIIAMPDEAFFHWRADVRTALAGHGDAHLSALYEASVDELVNRAAKAWSATLTGTSRS
jgi:hypothetical protein